VPLAVLPKARRDFRRLSGQMSERSGERALLYRVQELEIAAARIQLQPRMHSQRPDLFARPWRGARIENWWLAYSVEVDECDRAILVVVHRVLAYPSSLTKLSD
jgi:hypothetical protein